ncbi:hypothetical protein F4781DRAFT_405083 [Annulohypoxylon bovei var. microspora]|nr:hypothetical protein F4781DRAFT_405083 [Annulohypoxylon bovei var. microspora]
MCLCCRVIFFFFLSLQVPSQGQQDPINCSQTLTASSFFRERIPSPFNPSFSSPSPCHHLTPFSIYHFIHVHIRIHIHIRIHQFLNLLTMSKIFPHQSTHR